MMDEMLMSADGQGITAAGVLSAAKPALISPRKRAFLENAERMAPMREKWLRSNSAYYADDYRYMRFIVPEGARVLDLGCGTGHLLASLKPSQGVGIDFSPAMIAEARKLHPELTFIEGDIENPAALSSLGQTFDYIVISDTIGLVEDIEETLRLLHPLCTSETRLVIAYYSPLWEPLIRMATALGQRMPQPQASLISTTDFLNILDLTDFEPIRLEWRQLSPLSFFGIGRLINRFIAPLPGIRRLCLRSYVVARSARSRAQERPSTSIIIPCRNESGNIERAITEMPRFGGHQEIVFVEGNSKDDTLAVCQQMRDKYAGTWDIKVLKQDGKGKGDAVRKGFAAATGDILMILDADLTVPPAALPKFYAAIADGKGEFINGTRLVYPLEAEAMRPLNYMANRAFAMIFSYLLNQRFTDTLCGTKVLRKTDYEKIVESRKYFGDFDPFGDFDLIFGAAKRSLRIVEVPVHYKARVFGETQISRFRDGWLLLRMVVFAFMKLKAI
jgi:SAM-dependent methyltransferase